MPKTKEYTRLFILLGLLMSLHINIHAQEALSPSVLIYIKTYAQLAIQEMDRTGFPASIKIAQGIIETNAGRSELVQQSNNHFGMKCKTNWTGEKVYHDDDATGECFRKYNSSTDSYIDHSNYIKSQPRYAFLYAYDVNDYKSWAWGLKNAGYATSSIYAQTLIKYIETYSLNSLNELNDDDSSALNSYINLVETNPSSLASLPKSNQIIESSGNTINNEKEEEVSTAADVVEIDKNNNPAEFQNSTFTINNLKVISGKANQSLLSIAQKHHVHLSQLLTWNELPKSTVLLKEDQLIFLEKKKKYSEKDYHIVKRGETLYDISQKEGVRLESLTSLNNTDKNKQLKNNQRILLNDEGKKSLISFHHKTKNKKHVTIHVVKQGESLYTIAKKYKVSIDSIKDANSMKRDALQIGQSLKIPK